VAIDPAALVIPEPPEVLTDEEIRDFVHERTVRCVAATVGEDEHSVGMREIIDIKHGGLEKWGFGVTYLGTSVPIEKVLDAAIEHAATVVLISTIITHADVHREMMEKLSSLAEEKGVRDRLLLIAGGTQVTDEIASASGMDAGFGRRTKGLAVASFIVQEMRARGL
jgi:D-ornithine 4,5-aminomutase subunit beta